jgi:uncharacterized protein (DUF1330 family)
MPAYIIVDVKINDPEAYEAYKKLTPGTLALYQGKFIVRGGKTEALEGGWDPERIVILEFPTMDLARKWWSSDEYAPAKKIRQAASLTRMIAVEGFTPA